MDNNSGKGQEEGACTIPSDDNFWKKRSQGFASMVKTISKGDFSGSNEAIDMVFKIHLEELDEYLESGQEEGACAIPSVDDFWEKRGYTTEMVQSQLNRILDVHKVGISSWTDYDSENISNKAISDSSSDSADINPIQTPRKSGLHVRRHSI